MEIMRTNNLKLKDIVLLLHQTAPNQYENHSCNPATNYNNFLSVSNFHISNYNTWREI